MRVDAETDRATVHVYVRIGGRYGKGREDDDMSLHVFPRHAWTDDKRQVAHLKYGKLAIGHYRDDPQELEQVISFLFHVRCFFRHLLLISS